VADLPPEVLVKALREYSRNTPPGTKYVLLNGRRTLVSSDPDVEARALKAMQDLTDRDTEYRANRD
jgi:hypothetical protein